MVSGKNIEMTRKFKAPVEIVFAAIEKGLLLKCTGLKEENFVNNFSQGGSYSLAWKSGGRCSGSYLQIVPLQKVKFTWKSEDCQGATTDDTVVTVTLFAHGNECELKLVHEGLDAGFCYEDHFAGWTSSLDDFVLDLNKLTATV